MTTKLYIYEDENGDEVNVYLPVKNEVCPECDGYGTVLNRSMAEHAYSVEEFYQDFDEEEQAEYFRRGGRYDVKCPLCHGRNVVEVVDEDKLQGAQKDYYKAIQERDERRARWDAEDRAIRRMESGEW